MKLENMSLRQKIGQMFMCGFKAQIPNAEVKSLIEEYQVGGIIYFRRNLVNPEQVATLSSDLQTAATIDNPLLIAIDQEGGMVARIEEGISLMPGSMTLGASRDTDASYQTAQICGKELRAMGINVNFAPDVDVNNNPLNPVIGVRSYGEDPKLVAQMGSAAVRGYQDAGVTATIKHFPGHGDTNSDSHYALPTILHDMDRLRSVELVPFIDAIENGADMVMSAHIIFPALEQEKLPSTLSPRVMQSFLREELGFKGVIVTDCLEMKAIDDHFGPAEGTVLAVEAGVDIVLISHTYEKQVAGINALVQAVEEGRISEARIDESVERVLALKAKLKQAEASTIGLNEVGLPASEEVAASVYEKSVTLVQNNNDIIPLASSKKTLVIWSEVRENTEVVEFISQKETLGYYLAEKMGDVSETRIFLDPTKQEIAETLKLVEAADQVIYVTYNATFAEGQIHLAKEVANLGKSFVVVAGRNPFDLVSFPEVPAYIAAYENRPLAMKAVAKVLLGEINAQGQLPVTISEKYAYGWSLS
ncbi:beta-N-acetylhexosaminidase [Paenibacillus sp. N1-5-1-14]|uniref:beta-N-acetylhexosaminidase n=1 Tax=Paenibacillus radicibacter TaxID=2972488 RepID=UPI002158F999|nr:beta-N-acetylhexosaminidase [Paenibacillus radicibacter]MCR8644060.1 beta-N-acetylhexosaminidase [Paenibacillus radicibacter]